MEGNPTDDVSVTLGAGCTVVALVVDDAAASVSTELSFLTTHAASRHTNTATRDFIWSL
jgi:hypothetical protein